jgi:hypothetical protein
LGSKVQISHKAQLCPNQNFQQPPTNFSGYNFLIVGPIVAYE